MEETEDTMQKNWLNSNESMASKGFTVGFVTVSKYILQSEYSCY